MLSDPASRGVLLGIVLLILFLDACFVGAFWGILPRLLGRASWYRGVQRGEKILYQYIGGGTYSGWVLRGVINAFVSNERFVARILWSHVALVDIPVAAIRHVRPGTWWWYRTVEIAYETDGRERLIELSTSRRAQSEMLSAFRSVGARVVAS